MGIEEITKQVEKESVILHRTTAEIEKVVVGQRHLGTQVYRPDSGSFEIKKGPIFHNIILADEINRAPAKVQSALLEAMQERQVTIGEETFPLERPFLVLATQNPIEQEGTYPLPEAQIDRFMLKIKVDL